MLKTIARERNLRSSLLLGAASVAVIAAAPAMAQDQSVETVVVTGSRIPQTGLYSTSPVTAIGQQEFKLQGATNVETLLRNLPATAGDGDNQTSNNGSGGQETVDLRDLGPIRTLVLVDGKRLVASNTAGTVDVSVIPAAMVDHVEVLTGGSSAVYGADAVAGVINLILRKDFQGMEIDGQYQATRYGDGQTSDINLLMGMNSADGKGNVTIYGGYTNRDAVLQGNRTISKFALHDGYFETCAGGPAGHPGSTAIFFGGFCHSGSSLIAEGRDLNTSTMFTPSRTAVPYDGRKFNFAPFNYFQTPDTRYTMGAEGHYEVNKSLDIYTRLTFAAHDATTQLAPTPIVSGFNVNFGNPLISAQEKAVLFTNNTSGACDPAENAVSGPTGPGGTFTADDTCQLFLGRRLVGNGDRRSTFNYDAYQMVIGAKGDLGSGWSYDVSAQYGNVLRTIYRTGDVDATRFQQGLLVNPNGTCEDPSGGCVPIDIFVTNGFSHTQQQFFTLNQASISTTSQWDMVGSVTGDLGADGIKSPWAKDGVGVAFGSEYRREASNFQPDDNVNAGTGLGFGGSPAVHGSYNVKEVFAEMNVPLVEGVPFFQNLSLDGAYRYSSYNIEGVTNTYKYGAQWNPSDDVMFRGSFQRAVRAPNINELFQPSAIGQLAANDPCAAGGTASAALCEATGVPAANYHSNGLVCPSGQCTEAAGGNPNLKPEVADTRSVGVVLTPTFLDGFTATVDYYDIKIAGFVGAIGGSVPNVLAGCYSTVFNPTQSAANAFCQAIHRDSAGRIFGSTLAGGHVDQFLSNAANVQTKGVDFEVNYQRDLDDMGWGTGLGSFAINNVTSYLQSFKQQVASTAPVQECKGTFGDVCTVNGTGGSPLPVWKANTRFTWYSPGSDISVSLLWRHLSGVVFDEVKLNGFFDPISGKLPSVDYFDLAGTWNITSAFELRAGINNLFEKAPPLVDQGLANAGVDSGNTFPGTYDVMGRTFFVGGSLKF